MDPAALVGLLRSPLLYLSLYLKEHRAECYRLLGAVREAGDWEAWLAFFLEGVRQTAEGAVATARRLTTLFDGDRKRIEAQAAGPGRCSACTMCCAIVH